MWRKGRCRFFRSGMVIEGIMWTGPSAEMVSIGSWFCVRGIGRLVYHRNFFKGRWEDGGFLGAAIVVVVCWEGLCCCDDGVPGRGCLHLDERDSKEG